MATTWFSMIGTPFTGIGVSALLESSGTLDIVIPDNTRYVRIVVEPFGRNEGLFTGPRNSKEMFDALKLRNIHAILCFAPAAAWKTDQNRLTGTGTLNDITSMIAEGIAWIRSYEMEFTQFSVEVLPGPDDRTQMYMTPLEYARLCANVAQGEPEANLIGPSHRSLPVGRDVFTEAFFQSQDIFSSWGTCGYATAVELRQRLSVTTATMNAVNMALPKLITQFSGEQESLQKVAAFMAHGFAGAVLDNGILPDPLIAFMRDHPYPGLIYRSEELSEQDRTVKILMSSTNNRQLYLVLCRPEMDDGTGGELQLVIQNATWTRVDRIVNLKFEGPPGTEQIQCTPRISDGVIRLTLRHLPISGAIITCTWEIHGPEIVVKDPEPPVEGEEPDPTQEEKDYVTVQTIVQLPVYRGQPSKVNYTNGTIYYDSLANDIKTFWDGEWHATEMLEYV